MQLSAVLKRIETRLKDLGLSADAASRAANKPDAIRNMRRAVQQGRQGVNVSTITALAPVLKTTLIWLLESKGPKDGDTAEARPRGVRLVGYVGAGAEAHYYAVAQGDLDEVPAPEDATDSTVAVEIRGDSLGSLFDRWLVFFDDIRSPVTSDLIGRLCVVGLADDRVLIKKIRRGRDGFYDLISNEGAEVIRNVAVDWAARVKSMVPR